MNAQVLFEVMLVFKGLSTLITLELPVLHTGLRQGILGHTWNHEQLAHVARLHACHWLCVCLLYLLVGLAVQRQVPLHLCAERRTEPAERANAVSSVPVLAELHMFPQRRVSPVRPLAIRARLNGRLWAVRV